MMTIPLFQVNAFTSEPFKGNPAAVCVTEHQIDENTMQLIAREMNLSETAFVQPLNGQSIHQANTFSLRWFTPKHEVAICGHATIAASEVLYSHFNLSCDHITFESQSGSLIARKTNEGIALDFPLDHPLDITPLKELLEALRIKEYKEAVIGSNTRKIVIHLNTIEDIMDLQPDFEKMKQLRFEMDVKGVGVTCKGNRDYDFISRYFNPWAGVNEDPVTGSVHTLLAAYWGNALDKKELKAYQASDRGGELILRIISDQRVELIGKAVFIFRGELCL